MKGEEFGLHRVLIPEGRKSIPQSAYKLDNKPELISEYETLLSVSFLQISNNHFFKYNYSNFFNITKRILYQ
jgi:hypothetical protein